MGRAYFYVSPDALCSALHLPKGTHIVGAEWDWVRDRLQVFAAHEAFPTPQEGTPLEQWFPLVTQHSRLTHPHEYVHGFTSEWRK